MSVKKTQNMGVMCPSIITLPLLFHSAAMVQVSYSAIGPILKGNIEYLLERRSVKKKTSPTKKKTPISLTSIPITWIL